MYETHWSFNICNSTWDIRMRRWFPNMPKPAFRRGKTLREELVRSKLPGKDLRRAAEDEQLVLCNG